MEDTVLVIGLGEVGKPLYEIISEHYACIGVDIEPVEFHGSCKVMHICYSFHIEDFIGKSIAYVQKYKPELTVVNSTVSPGTTRAIFEATGARIVHSPVRGKHFKMKQEMLHYDKFIGGIIQEDSLMAAAHFESLGMKTRILASPEATEIAKLTETTYFGVMIAWAQEVERYCDAFSLNYDEITSFYDEIKFFPPVKYFPGVIGGHCVMPNIKILKTAFQSNILNAIENSNRRKIERDSTT